MKNKYLFYLLSILVFSSVLITSCGSNSDDEMPPEENPTETDFTDHLTNQVNEIIIPTMEEFQVKMNDFVNAVDEFTTSTNEVNLTSVRAAYQSAYLAYQPTAVHYYFATANQALVKTSNLYPVDITCLLYTSPSPRDRTRSRMPSSA